MPVTGWLRGAAVKLTSMRGPADVERCLDPTPAVAEAMIAEASSAHSLVRIRRNRSAHVIQRRPMTEESTSSRARAVPFLIAVVISAALILSAPFVGRIRG